MKKVEGMIIRKQFWHFIDHFVNPVTASMTMRHVVMQYHSFAIKNKNKKRSGIMPGDDQPGAVSVWRPMPGRASASLPAIGSARTGGVRLDAENG
jgi:hypothetical protein